MNEKALEKLPRRTYVIGLICHILVRKNKKLVFILIFITKIRHQMLTDVIQTGKHGTATKESALQILLLIQILLQTPNA